jgi:hypothetical protein
MIKHEQITRVKRRRRRRRNNKMEETVWRHVYNTRPLEEID